jgi:hypothetical protein
MRKHFKTNAGSGCFFCDTGNFLERKLAGEDDPGKTLLRSPPDTIGIMNRHLG